MQALSVRLAPRGGGRLGSLPFELLAHIVFGLASLSDLVSLAATCQRVRSVCDDIATPICKKFFNTYYLLARQLLADQGGPKLEDILSTHQAAVMLRNWRVIKGSIAKFEWQVVRHLKSNRYAMKMVYGVNRHPPRLTPSERRRFIRTYYRLWSFMIIPLDLWKSRFAVVPSLRDLHYLAGLCFLNQSIGSVEDLGPPNPTDVHWYIEWGLDGLLDVCFDSGSDTDTDPNLECVPSMQLTGLDNNPNSDHDINSSPKPESSEQHTVSVFDFQVSHFDKFQYSVKREALREMLMKHIEALTRKEFPLDDSNEISDRLDMWERGEEIQDDRKIVVLYDYFQPSMKRIMGYKHWGIRRDSDGGDSDRNDHYETNSVGEIISSIDENGNAYTWSDSEDEDFSGSGRDDEDGAESEGNYEDYARSESSDEDYARSESTDSYYSC